MHLSTWAKFAFKIWESLLQMRRQYFGCGEHLKNFSKKNKKTFENVLENLYKI